MKKNECTDFFRDLKLGDSVNNFLEPKTYADFIKAKISNKDKRIRHS